MRNPQNPILNNLGISMPVCSKTSAPPESFMSASRPAPSAGTAHGHAATRPQIAEVSDTRHSLNRVWIHLDFGLHLSQASSESREGPLCIRSTVI